MAPITRVSDREMQVYRPTGGVYAVHERGQRPVEGVMVYEYKRGVWVCERCGQWNRMTLGSGCQHVQLAQRAKAGLL